MALPRLGFRIGAAGLGALALSTLGCMQGQKQPQGELLGAYEISGVLTENSCGQTALPTKNPLSFLAELRDTAGVTTWQIEKRPAYSGVLKSDGEYSFVSESAFPLGEAVRPKKDVQPSDFFSGNPDADIERGNCTLLMRESIEGTVHRMLSVDGGVQDGDDTTAAADLEGDNTIEVSASAGSNCFAVLAANGGGFQTLPCKAHYSLEGTLQAAEPEK